MTDRELLELAAKAGGIVLECYHDDKLGFEKYDGDCWNPLGDDGDAFRLAVELGIGMCHHIEWSQVFNPQTGVTDFNHDGNALAATRRAIVQAAAKIGKHK